MIHLHDVLNCEYGDTDSLSFFHIACHVSQSIYVIEVLFLSAFCNLSKIVIL
jgi:hypothetical protein